VLPARNCDRSVALARHGEGADSWLDQAYISGAVQDDWRERVIDSSKFNYEAGGFKFRASNVAWRSFQNPESQTLPPKVCILDLIP